MHIAYISYEYPPDTAVGGIATYVHQVARIMQKRNHHIEVFCASPHRAVSEEIEGIQIHRVLCTDRAIFKNTVLPIFENRHAVAKFDIIESPEFSGDGLAVKFKFPLIPLVVKLHTPWFLVGQLNAAYISRFKKIKFIASGLVRGKFYKPFWKPRPKETDADYLITKLADQVHAPSISLGKIISDKWNISKENIFHVPYPYIPQADLLKIDAGTLTNNITYVGRLEIRKGLVGLARAVNIVLEKCPSVRFTFVGSVEGSPKKGLDMKAYLLKKLKKHQGSLRFSEVSPDKIAEIYAAADICVFPSIWENFPNTCLEAMSAARGIVASKNGGMKDMLEDCDGGILIDPLNHVEIADALILLINNKALTKEKGINARAKILSAYNSEVIGSLMEQRYRGLIS